MVWCCGIGGGCGEGVGVVWCNGACGVCVTVSPCDTTSTHTHIWYAHTTTHTCRVSQRQHNTMTTTATNRAAWRRSCGTTNGESKTRSQPRGRHSWTGSATPPRGRRPKPGHCRLCPRLCVMPTREKVRASPGNSSVCPLCKNGVVGLETPGWIRRCDVLCEGRSVGCAALYTLRNERLVAVSACVSLCSRERNGTRRRLDQRRVQG